MILNLTASYEFIKEGLTHYFDILQKGTDELEDLVTPRDIAVLTQIEIPAEAFKAYLKKYQPDSILDAIALFPSADMLRRLMGSAKEAVAIEALMKFNFKESDTIPKDFILKIVKETRDGVFETLEEANHNASIKSMTFHTNH